MDKKLMLMIQKAGGAKRFLGEEYVISGDALAALSELVREDEREKIARRFYETSMLTITESQAIRRIRARQGNGNEA